MAERAAQYAEIAVEQPRAACGKSLEHDAIK
jgi:hypothetical protein